MYQENSSEHHLSGCLGCAVQHPASCAVNSDEMFTTLHCRPGLQGNTFNIPAVSPRAELTFRDR